MFGLFENKKAKAMRDETLRTIEHANLLSQKDRNKVAKNLFNHIIKCINEIDGIAPGDKLDNIMKKQLQNATKQRQKNVTHLEERNPKWIEFALLESFLIMNSGMLGPKLASESIIVGNWCRENMSETDLKKLEKKMK